MTDYKRSAILWETVTGLLVIDVITIPAEIITGQWWIDAVQGFVTAALVISQRIRLNRIGR